jgi:phosphoglycerate dehydrogenase-like enzyme
MSNEPINVLITLPFPEELLDQIKQVSSRIHLMPTPARNVDEINADTWKQVEVLYTDRILPAPEAAPKLNWVQFHYAGIDHATGNPLLQHHEIDFTSLSGAAAPQVAEYALMMLLALGHRMPELHINQSKAGWPPDRWERYKPHELRGSTVGILGYGSIGRELARMLQPLDVRILAAKRDAMHPQDNNYIPEGLGDPEGALFDRLYPYQAIKSMLKECDFVLVCVPLTPETRGLIGEEELGALKPTAFIVDVSRGGIIQPQALLNALQDKKIAGAALDVFAEEPLPPTSPFWKLPNVLISPHISGISFHYDQRAVDLFCENLKRYVAGSPLYNKFDPDLGY